MKVQSLRTRLIVIILCPLLVISVAAAVWQVRNTTNRAEEIRFLIVRSAYLLASRSFVERQQERYEEVLERAREFLRRYDTSGYRKDVVEYRVNAEKRLKQLEDVRYQSQGSRS